MISQLTVSGPRTWSPTSVHAVPRTATSVRANIPSATTRFSASILLMSSSLARDLHGLECLLVDVLVVFVRLDRGLAPCGVAALLDDDLDERLDHHGVELGARVRAQLAQRLFRPERHAIGPLAGHGVVRIGHADDLRGQRDLAALEAVRVTGPIEVLVTGEHDRAEP